MVIFMVGLPGEKMKGAYDSRLVPQAHSQFQNNNLEAMMQTVEARSSTKNRGGKIKRQGFAATS
jgi:hypothetical protein